MRLQESSEMYLETIYVLSKKNPRVRSIDVADYMGYSKPSISRAVSILKKNGYVQMNEDSSLSLTETGRAVAEKVFERHNVITEFLLKLGVEKATASEDACKMEHVISDETLEAIKRALEQK
ncbi:MAG: metal-dependent transcriptional regulator [Ruminococcaceae bacterium]|nr:metal-dependent transcriptional regulator [Oscillospiraceae bacterium]